MRKWTSSFVFAFLLTTLSCPAKEPPSQQVVDLTASDGIKLKVSYFAAGEPGARVLLLHQCDHDRKIWDGLAQQMAAAGIHVLTMDLRGYGDSGDRPHNKVGSPGPIEPPEGCRSGPETLTWPSDT